MKTINESKRIIKRIILSNLYLNNSSLYLTPLISGKHGIGKTNIVKEIALEINGRLEVIEGGVLKEGEITGLPYLEKKGDDTYFSFVTYYIFKRVQDEEKRLYFDVFNLKEKENDILDGKENRYSNNDLKIEEKIDLLKEKKVTPFIIFIDEINRTDSNVYRELMNILLTRKVNGYTLPWWCFFVAAMNPSSEGSLYATNEMDPAQLDRFIKIKVKEDKKEFISYAKEKNMDESIINFINKYPTFLSEKSKNLDDNDNIFPSPRSYEMINTIIKAEPYIRIFMSNNSKELYLSDLEEIVESKIGIDAGIAFIKEYKTKNEGYDIEKIFGDDFRLTHSRRDIISFSMVEKVALINAYTERLNESMFSMIHNINEEKFRVEQVKTLYSILDDASKILFIEKLNSIKYLNKNLIIYFKDAFPSNVLIGLNINGI